MVQCNSIQYEATVQWRSFVASARSPSPADARNRALKNAINKGTARGQRYNPKIREWYVVKMARLGRGSTLNCTFSP